MKDKYEMVLNAQYADAPDDAKRFYAANGALADLPCRVGIDFGNDRMVDLIADMMSNMSDEGWDYLIGHAKDENERAALAAKKVYFKTIRQKKDAEDELPDVLETIEPTETASDDEPADFREIVHVNIVSDTKETFDTTGAAKTTETEPTDFRKIASFLRHVAERLENGDADLENAVLAAKKSLDKVISASQTEIS